MRIIRVPLYMMELMLIDVKCTEFGYYLHSTHMSVDELWSDIKLVSVPKDDGQNITSNNSRKH